MTLELLFPDAFVKALASMLVLIVLDLAFGVAVAVREKKFDLKKLADFYRTTVMPNLLGWAVADIVVRAAAYYELPVVTQLEPLLQVSLLALPTVALLAGLVDKLGKLRAQPE